MGIEFTNEMLNQMIGYIGNVFSDLSGLLLLIVGVGLGLAIVGAIVRMIRS